MGALKSRLPQDIQAQDIRTQDAQAQEPMALYDERLVCTKDLEGMKVWIEKPRKNDADAVKKMGRVRGCVFHPEEKRCVGFMVKRPDLAWMFHRKDRFVAFNGYGIVGGVLVVHDSPEASEAGACKALGIDLDDCVMWAGLPVMCLDGTQFGLVGSVSYDAQTGAVAYLDVTQGAAANALLGVMRVPASLIRGFRRGMGTRLSIDTNSVVGKEDDVSDRTEKLDLGALLVDDSVKKLTTEGGLAEKAGAATAAAGDTMRRTAQAMMPKIDEAKAAATKAAGKGAYATGRQLKRAKGMFAAFKEEFDKASRD